MSTRVTSVMATTSIAVIFARKMMPSLVPLAIASIAESIGAPGVSSASALVSLVNGTISAATASPAGVLMTDASHTPVAVMDVIRERLAKGNISLEILVPRSLDYYERLIGRIDGQVNIAQYADEVATERKYNERDLETSVSDFMEERKASLDWLRGLREPDWQIVYQHPPLAQYHIRSGDFFVV